MSKLSWDLICLNGYNEVDLHGRYCKLTCCIQCLQVESINSMWLAMHVYSLSANHHTCIYVPSHTGELVSGTADSEGVETTPEMVSHSLLIALCAVNKW